MKVFIVLCLATLALSAPLALEEQWQKWKLQHGKSYSNDVEESMRRAVWFRSYHYIQEHNSQTSNSFQLALNSLSDMTHEEYLSDYLTPQTAQVSEGVPHEVAFNVTYPYSLDWRMKGFVTEVKDQGTCSSSWAFSATGALEGQLYKATRQQISLSEQQLLDCSINFGNKGCSGGVSTNAFMYVNRCGGICRESAYPYLGYVYYCADQHCSSTVTCAGFSTLPSGSENSLLDAVYNIGPISVTVDASSIQFQYYTSGIYCDTSCSQSNLNHAMLVVGYGTDESTGVDYWIIKNSWGRSWGSNGYMKMIRNKNMCGVATAASYPIL
jgi:C1A family cysteine protease